MTPNTPQNDPFVKATNALANLIRPGRPKTVLKARFKNEASKMKYLQRLVARAGIRAACEWQLITILRHKMRKTCKTYMTLADYIFAVLKNRLLKTFTTQPRKEPLMKNNLILLAEDSDDDVSMLLHEFKMAKLNNPVWTVPNGEATISYLQGTGIYEDRSVYPYPIVLLLDLRMPGKSGIDVLQWIRERPEHKNLPVIVSTGSREVHQMSCCYQLGARYFMVKPIRIKELRHAIARIPELRTVSEKDEMHLDLASEPAPWQPSLALESGQLQRR